MLSALKSTIEQIKFNLFSNNQYLKQERVDYLYNQLPELLSAISDLNDKVDYLQEESGSLPKELNDRLEFLEENLEPEELEDRIGFLESAVDSMEEPMDKVEFLESEVAAMKEQVNSLEGDLPLSIEIKNLEARASNLSKDIRQLHKDSFAENYYSSIKTDVE